MSDQFYENLRDKTAGPLLEKYGMPLVLTRSAGGTVDENSGIFTPGTDTNYDCFGLIEDFDERVVSYSLVRADEKKLILSAQNLAIVPQVGDKFTMPDGIWYVPDGDGFDRIPPVKVLAPGGIPILYTLRVRK